MDIIEMTRALGKAIQQDERYIRLSLARDNNDNDEKLQEMIGKFNLKRVEVNQEAARPDKDQAKLDQLNESIRTLYKEIMENPNMVEFNAAKEEIDSLMNFVNQILVLSVNGQDPDTVEQSSCTGSCATCAGCH
ncbi:MAG: YlbF family regulator [Oscillospiraceae bacterium]|jgi:cell fate (sporulation/competence/biofilm development) regulator YlbF (YheA/YmcA/DUF963 family)|nr:YlbF family regulator [Oscillospiraceae bacterium]